MAWIGYAALVAFALLPAVFALKRGRALDPNDPALPERLAATQKRNWAVFSFALSAVIVLSFLTSWSLLWMTALLVIARIFAAYPVRKALYGETWGPWAYFSFFARLITAVFGFWVLLLALPALALMAGERGWILGAVLGVVLFAWSARFQHVFAVLVRARPIDDPILSSRFVALAEACGLPPVRFLRAEVNGGVFANAVALPATKDAAVVFSSTLLDRLTPDESCAICAHELAHLEHFNPRRVRKLAGLTTALIAAGVAVGPLARVLSLESNWVVYVVWLIAVCVFLVWRARDSQANETASDLRALALTGDAETLINALTKTCRTLNLPRRYDPEVERASTHPSLAHRIQAIRAAAGGPAASLSEDARFTGADGVTTVTFAAARLVWRAPLGAHEFPYEQLTDLRVKVAGPGASQLIATDVEGRSWTMTLDNAEIARAQAVLDIVDSRLGSAKPAAVLPLSLVRSAALIAALSGLALGQTALIVVGLLAAASPSVPMGVALGTATLTAAVLGWRDAAAGFRSDATLFIVLTLLVCSAVSWGTAWINRRDPPPASTPKAIALVALLAVVALVPIGFALTDVLSFHAAARTMQSATLLLLTLGCAAAMTRSMIARTGALVLVLGGLTTAYAGSTDFLDRFADDTFLTPVTTSSSRTVLDRSDSRSFPLPFEASDVRVAPGGRYVALIAGSGRGEGTSEIRLGAPGGPYQSFTADEAVFTGDADVLLMNYGRTGVTISLVTLDPSPEERWSQKVPGLVGAQLIVDRHARAWRLVGWDDEGRIATATGTTAGTPRDVEATIERRWTGPADTDLVPISAAGDEALALESSYDDTLGTSAAWWRLALLFGQGIQSTSKLWRLGSGAPVLLATSRMTLSCGAEVVFDARPVCVAFDGSRTRLYAVNGTPPHVTPLATLDGHFFNHDAASQGWMTGWLSSGEIVAIHVDTGEIVEMAGGDRRIFQIDMSDTVAGALTYDGERRYALEMIPLTARRAAAR